MPDLLEIEASRKYKINVEMSAFGVGGSGVVVAGGWP